MGCREEFYKDGKLLKVVDTRKVEEEKTERIRSLKEGAKKALAKTDWMVVRNFEIGKAIDAEIVKKRSDMRLEIEKIESDFGSIKTLEEYDKYYGYANFKLLKKRLEAL